MTKSYCLRQRKKTDNLAGSESYVTTKNGRTMLKSICAECNAKKSQFIKGKSGGFILNKKVWENLDPSVGLNRLERGVKNMLKPLRR